MTPVPLPSRSSALVALCCSAVWALGCGQTLTQVSEDDVVTLRMAFDSAEVAIARTLQLRAYPLDATGSLLILGGVSWQSLNSQVATVDARGLVAGVAQGETRVIAQIGVYADTTVVTVDLLPELTLSADSVGFEVTAGGPDPAATSVDISNTGGLTLDGLAIDSVRYTGGAADWLSAQLDSPVAPATLDMVAITAGITAAGVYRAVLWLSATDADGSPASVVATLEVAPGAPASDAFQIFQGNNQTAITGTVVATLPTVILRDDFDNPVPGATITFAASGGGTVDPPSVMTDADGHASTTWTVSADGHTMAPNGTYPNTLTASATGLSPLQFTGLARYSFATHVNPIFPVSCAGGCHGSSVFTLSYTNLVDVASNCGGAAFPRVSSAGGDTGANASILLLYLTPGASPPCGFNHIEIPVDDPRLVVFRSWIRNSAPDN